MRFHGVSILARLWGRALPFNDVLCGHFFEFQSSPGFGAGRYRQNRASPMVQMAFQSSPGFGAGRYRAALDVAAMVGVVSILARLWGRALRKSRDINQICIVVSILARLWGRALRAALDVAAMVGVVSILARLWGRALPARLHRPSRGFRFQSSPGFGAGRYTKVRSR